MKPLPFLGGGLAGKSYTVTRQRKLNIYLEHRPDGDKGVKVVAYGTPGMKVTFTNTAAPTTPFRGILGTPATLYGVAAGAFYQFTPTGTLLFSSSTLLSASGLVSMAQGPTQVLLVDGVAGYLYNGTTLATIAASFPNGAKTITFVAGFFVAEQPGSQNFWVSNLFDGSTWNGLAFAAASQYSDNILAVDNLNGNLVIFCQLHQEYWQNVGSTPQPFAPILSATNEWGLAAIFSRAHVDSSIIFLGVTRAGQVQICQIVGYNVKVISTADLDSVINGFSNSGITISDAVALTYQIDTHAFYQLTFPSANRSFLYDCSTSIWSETQTGHTTAYAARHMGNLSTLCANRQLLSDATSGNLYVQDPTVLTDNGAVIERELISRHAIEGYNEFTVDELYLDMETGVGNAVDPGANPQVMLQISRDDGKTWETEQWAPLGAQGVYGTRVVWRRLGSARHFTFKLRLTDPVKFVIANGALTARERPQ